MIECQLGLEIGLVKYATSHGIRYRGYQLSLSLYKETFSQLSTGRTHASYSLIAHFWAVPMSIERLYQIFESTFLSNNPSTGPLDDPRKDSRLQVLIEPIYRLQKSLLLCIFHGRLAQIATRSKPVLNPRIQIDLIRHLQFLQDDLCRMSLIRRERPIRFCIGQHVLNAYTSATLTGSSNSKRAPNRLNLVICYKARVCNISRLSNTLLQKPHHALGPKTVTHRPNHLTPIRLAHLLQRRLHYLINALRGMLCAPSLHVKALGTVQLDGVAMELVGHEDKVPICCELVGGELGVDQADANYIGEE
jgi:hypothetical protein